MLIEANPDTLVVACEHLIKNNLSSKANFIAAFVSDTDDTEVKLWTVGLGSASSCYPEHAKSASSIGSYICVPTITLDTVCSLYGIIPDLIKIDVEGAEYEVLRGSARLASHQSSRFFVEVHANPSLPLLKNTVNILRWCDEVEYRAWYLKEAVHLADASQIKPGGGCHLLLQPASWKYPEWLKGIAESSNLAEILQATENEPL